MAIGARSPLHFSSQARAKRCMMSHNTCFRHWMRPCIMRDRLHHHVKHKVGGGVRSGLRRQFMTTYGCACTEFFCRFELLSQCYVRVSLSLVDCRSGKSVNTAKTKSVFLPLSECRVYFSFLCDARVHRARPMSSVLSDASVSKSNAVRRDYFPESQ